VPFMGERGDLLVDEAAHHLAKGVMLGGIERALHRTLASQTDSSRSAWPEPRRLTCAEWLAGGTTPGRRRPSNSTQDDFCRSPANSELKNVDAKSSGGSPRATPGRVHGNKKGAVQDRRGRDCWPFGITTGSLTMPAAHPARWRRLTWRASAASPIRSST